MSQGKLNGVSPSAITGGSRATDIAKQGMTPGGTAPGLGTMPGAFGQPGGYVAQPKFNQFGGFGQASPAVVPPGGFQQPVAPDSDMPSGGIMQQLMLGDPSKFMGMGGEGGGLFGTTNNKSILGQYNFNPAGGGLFQPGGQSGPDSGISAVLPSQYAAGVNTPAPEDELGALGGPDTIGEGY